MKFLGFGERFDGDELAFAENTSWFHILVDEAFHGEDQLIVEGRHRFFGKAADVEFEGISAATEAADKFSAKNGSHAGGKAAVGSESDAVFLSFAGEREFLADDGVVSTQVGEVATRLDGRFCQPEVETIGNGGERSIMTAHQLGTPGRKRRPSPSCRNR